MSKSIAVVAALAVLYSTACSQVNETELHDHKCVVQINSIWYGANIDGTIDHSDGRQCPLDVQLAGFVQQGATVYDNTASYPHSGNAVSLEIEAFDEYDYRNFYGSWPLASSATHVWFSFYLDPQEGWVWKGDNVINFARGPGPDHVEHRVLLNNEADFAKAVIELTYGCGELGEECL